MCCETESSSGCGQDTTVNLEHVDEECGVENKQHSCEDVSVSRWLAGECEQIFAVLSNYNCCSTSKKLKNGFKRQSGCGGFISLYLKSDNVRSGDNVSIGFPFSIPVPRYLTPGRRRGRSLWDLCLLIFLLLPYTHGQMRPDTDMSRLNSNGVCQSIDIRNSVDAFEKRLRGCQVVEGFVQILLIDHADESHFENLSFPELREITGYLLLYRVNGLRTLSTLFPNLAVIRGNILFLNYALVAFEMMHLQEIGLHSLTNITRGSVRLEKNPQLCYVKTIDWDIIADVGREGNYIKNNRRENECPPCPIEKQCPLKTEEETPLCWNRQHCQKVCSACNGSTCDMNGNCCSLYCLGGCDPTDKDSCFVCRNFVTGGGCVRKCPPGYYEYLDRRCVTEQECRDMKTPLELIQEEEPKRWKPFNGSRTLQRSCVLDCPVGYAEVTIKNRLHCEHCKVPPLIREC